MYYMKNICKLPLALDTDINKHKKLAKRSRSMPKKNKNVLLLW